MKKALIVAYVVTSVSVGAAGFAVNTVVELTKKLAQVEKAVKANKAKKAQKVIRRAGTAALSVVPVLGTVAAITATGYIAHDYCEGLEADNEILKIAGVEVEESTVEQCLTQFEEDAKETGVDLWEDTKNLFTELLF